MYMYVFISGMRAGGVAWSEFYFWLMLPDERGMLGADERIVLLDEDERIVLLDEDERLGVATR